MGLIDFLEGAYRGGRLLLLLYDHDKQVKLRYKAMKGKGIKRLPNTIDNIVQVREIVPVNRPLVNEQKSQRKSPLDEEIELSNKLGYYVNVYSPSNMIDPVEIKASYKKLPTAYVETGYLYHPYTSTADKVKKIKRLRKKLWERIKEENSPKPYYELPKDGIMSHYSDISGGTSGALASLASTACESLTKAAKLKKKRELALKEYRYLTQNLNEK